jgi:ATP-dependent DNA ligase
MPPVSPMLARPVASVPAGPGYLYEPKWDGFRAVIFRDGEEVEIGSRNERPLTRYFPEVVAASRAALPERAVVDGEIIIAGARSLDFEALLARIHPAASRVTLLAEQTPASFVAFDLLALGDDDLTSHPQAQRRELLAAALAGTSAGVHLTPATQDPEVAQLWFERFEGAGLDGVVAKPLELPYRQGERAMLKIKHSRTADCVVAGLRWHKSGPVVGSLLLGLYDAAGVLQSVGVCSSFTQARRRELVDELGPWRMDSLAGHPWAAWAQGGGESRMPGSEASRWNRGKDLSWVPLRPERVCEVGYDHLEGRRFRHTTQFRRWREDREPRSCTYAQLEEPVSYDLAEVLSR